MILRDYENIWPIGKPVWWYAALAGFLLNSIYSFALVSCMSFIPYDKHHKAVPFAVSAATIAGHCYYKVFDQPYDTLGKMEFVSRIYAFGLPMFYTVMQAAILWLFPDSVPVKYH